MKRLLFSASLLLLLSACGDNGKTVIRTTGSVTEYEWITDSGRYHCIDSPFIFTPSLTTYTLNKRRLNPDFEYPCEDNPYTITDSRYSRWESDCMLDLINQEKRIWNADGWQVVKYDTLENKGGTDVDWLVVELRKSKLIEPVQK